MTFFKRSVAGLVACLSGLTIATGSAVAANAAKTVEIKGEIIDTWCYLSGVMGGPDAVVGSAHHTCALWCAAGGIPVGVRAEDGTVYMVLKIKGEDPLAQTDTIMEIQSNTIVAKGAHYLRDGIDYLVVEKVVANEGITNKNHEDFGVVPEFAFPEAE
jgi:anaerobic selenocysteine-containing dehydrogenase